MTEKLKNLLHERAELADFPVPDIDALTRDGARRVRRQRGAALAAVVGIVVVAVGLPLALQSGGDDRARDDSSVVADGAITSVQAFPRGQVVWAEDETIHYGGATLDVGRPVQAFVQTKAGFLVASDGDVLAADGGEVIKVGEVDPRAPRLVGDESGTIAGWVQDGSDGSAFAVHDLASDVTSAEPAGDEVEGFEGALAAPYLYAIDDRTAYWRSADGIFSGDLVEGTVGTRLGGTTATTSLDILDVEDGVLAFYQDGTLSIGTSPDTAVPMPVPEVSRGVLSPNSAYYSPDEERLVVLAVGTGREVTPSADGFAFSTGYAWLDDETVAVLAQAEGEAAFSLLTCSVPAGSCETAVDDIGAAPGDFQLPTGETFG